MLSKNTNYLSRLDHLRFFAALLVTTYHFHGGMVNGATLNPLLMIIKEGETGVSLFMILSGFILTRISIGKEINYRSFVFNRVLRIYPLYIVMLFIAAFSGGRHMDFVSLLALLSPVGNLGNVILPKFPHIWTIAVEFQFYLIFPFIIGFFARYGTRYLIGLICFAILVRAMMYLTDGTIQDGAYWTILGRIDQFAIGMIAAVIYGLRRKWLASPVALALSLFVVWAWFFVFTRWTGGFYGKDTATSIAWVISPAAEALVWGAAALAYLQQKWTMPVLADKTFAYLGGISFSMYMWHYPVILIFYKYFPDWNGSPHWYMDFALIALPTIIAISSLSYFIIERPFFALRTIYVKAQALSTGASIERPPSRSRSEDVAASMDLANSTSQPEPVR
ncbi:acyltransferase [Paraburkholderia madseniana]|uniref:acyltransferase family protein n=1 Tax=Paraburkholderia madseniana TaxID=2599607 RepID=UPI0038BDC9EB